MPLASENYFQSRRSSALMNRVEKEMTKQEKADRLIAKLQKQENAALDKRRRCLADGLKRALPHLLDYEMTDIEETIYRAVGRSIICR